MIKRPIQEILCFILYFHVGIYSCERAEWRTHVLIYYHTTWRCYSPISWKFQTACISLNISRPLNPIKLKSSPCLRYIWSYKSVTSLMGVTFIGSATSKLWYLLPIFLHSIGRYMTWPLNRHSFEVNKGFNHIVKWWSMELVEIFQDKIKNHD